MRTTLIIGAGMTGIACARALHDAGRSVRILDKGRGIGGRMATRRAETRVGNLSFGHGAQYVSAHNPAFATLLDELATAAAWEDGATHPHYVGVPGMSNLPRTLAAGLDVKNCVEVTSIRRENGAWQVSFGDDKIEAKQVVLTVPVPQIAPLVGSDHPLIPALGAVQMGPSLTLMAAFLAEGPPPFVSQAFSDGPLSYIARIDSKPGRPTAATTWVAQASAIWSTEHIEEEKEKIAQMMLPLLCDIICVDPARVLHLDAHRWRYARVTMPLGQPFLRDTTGTLHMGGDWCLGSRVEAAWESGTAIARDILRGSDV